MEKEIVGALIGVGGAIVGGVFGWWGSRENNRIQREIAEQNRELQKSIASAALRTQERSFIDGVLLRMMDYQIQHPHLESDDFCHAYPATSGNAEMRLRYEAYCTFVFNFLSMAFHHFEKKADLLGAYIGLEEILTSHRNWWHVDLNNQEYDSEFRHCIQTVIDKLRKERK